MMMTVVGYCPSLFFCILMAKLLYEENLGTIEQMAENLSGQGTQAAYKGWYRL